jgi:hypothetical protein
MNLKTMELNDRIGTNRQGINLIGALLEEIANPKRELPSTIRQQIFQVFKVMTTEIVLLKMERDQEVVMAAYEQFKTGLLELKLEQAMWLHATTTDKERKRAILDVVKEIDEMLGLLEDTKESCLTHPVITG